MKKSLVNLYDYFNARKPLLYALTAGLFILVGVLASRIKIEEDISRMMPNGEQTRRINQIISHSRFTDNIIVKISGNESVSPDSLIELADSLESRLKANCGPLISNIKSKVDDEVALDIYKTVHNSLPVYLDEKDYAAIDTLITPQHINAALENDYKTLSSASGLVMKRIIADDPIGISTIALKKLQSLQLDEIYDLYDGYIMTKDHRNLLMFITPVNAAGETAKNAPLAEELDKIARGLSREKIATVYFYGGAVAAVSNANQLKKDTTLTLTITIVGLILFIGFFFRRKRVPFIMMLPVVFGGLFAIAVMAVVRGSISSIALGAGSVVLGIAVNYSLHFFSHYKHCGSIKETIVDLFEPMTIGSFTTVGSFFSLMFLQSQILYDFGFFAGMSLTGATIFSLIFLPHFVPLQKDHVADTAHESWFDKLPQLPHKYAFIPFAAVIALTIYFFPLAMQVGFESDLNNFNFLTPTLKKSEQEINKLQSDSSKTVFIASTGKNMQEALRNNEILLQQLERFKEKGWVKKYSSINYFIPSKDLQYEKINRWNNYWTKEKKRQLLNNLQHEGAQFHFKATAFGNFDALLNKEYEPGGEEDFSAIRAALGNDYLIATDNFQSVVNSVSVERKDRAKLYPELEKELHTVILDKQVITNKFIDIIYNDFNSILAYTSLLVFFALLLSYGRLELTIITFLPMLISWIWILGIMELFGLKFNIINIIISTFIFGLGDDFSIFITDGLTRKYAEGKETLSSHKVSIFLSAATIIIGLGALIFAQHPALRSIAVVSIIGIFCVLLVGQITQPFIYNFFAQSRKERDLAPWTFPTLLLSAFAFSYFVIGAFILTVIGATIIYLLPFPSKKTRKLMYHFLLSKFLGSLLYVMANTRKVHINKKLMDFSKPAIIISNHTSFLDILITVMQNTKIILLTNKWVYYSPFFGFIVRMGDYYPVMEGADPATDKLEGKVKEGYSIVVFPEGTRSPDGKMKRFHKGAFFLAEKLNMDIAPLLLHGVTDTMRKSDFMLFNGQMTMKYLPRITPDDKSFGEDYAEHTKNIARYFKAEFEKLRQQIETSKYFKQRLITNYQYKGPYLEYYTRYKLRKEKYYQSLSDALPHEGRITVAACGYGWMNYALSFPWPNRTITGLDANEVKIDVANNCYSKNERLMFLREDIYSYPYEKSDAFVLNELPDTDNENIRTLLKNIIPNLNPGGSIIVVQQGNDTASFERIKQDAVEIGLMIAASEQSTGSPFCIIKQKSQ